MGKRIFVENKKCRKDDLCVKICPSGLIIRDFPDGFPIMKVGNDDLCMSCGHCVAICPYGALNHSDVNLEKCPPVNKDLTINIDQAAQFLRSRRSVRFFKTKSVEKQIIESLIQIGRYAPTGGNTQSVEWTVINDRAIIKKLASLSIEALRKDIVHNPSGINATTVFIPEIVNNWDKGIDEILWDAPVFILASAASLSDTGKEDLILALSYLELAATSLGLGTCWTGSFTDSMLLPSSIKKILKLSEDHIHYYSMVMGYPKFRFKRLIQRREAKIRWV